MNKSEARLVQCLLRWALEDHDVDPSGVFYDLAARAHAALGTGPDRYEVARAWAERRPRLERRPAPTPPHLLEHRLAERAARIDKAQAAFQPWMRYLSIERHGRRSGVFQRVKQAMWDVQNFRQESNTDLDHFGEQATVATRVAADTLATQIDAAAGTDRRLDPYTVAWVTAGLRCPLTPFCQGCTACQTVTSPLRGARAGEGG